MPTVPELLECESFFDAAIIRHGFTDYMRDYEIVVANRGGPPADHHRYQFVGCVEAHCRTEVHPACLVASLPDEFVLAGSDDPVKGGPVRFIWAVRCSRAYPGLTYVERSERAAHWSRLLDRAMHEVTVETEAFFLTLVIAEVRYECVAAGTLRGDQQRDFPIDLAAPGSSGSEKPG